jgi:hypothetical protein
VAEAGRLPTMVPPLRLTVVFFDQILGQIFAVEVVRSCWETYCDIALPQSGHHAVHQATMASDFPSWSRGGIWSHLIQQDGDSRNCRGEADSWLSHLGTAWMLVNPNHQSQLEGGTMQMPCRQEGDPEWADRCLAAGVESFLVLWLDLEHWRVELAGGCLAHFVLHQTLLPRPYFQARHTQGPPLLRHFLRRILRPHRNCQCCLGDRHIHPDPYCAEPKRPRGRTFDHIWGRCEASRQCEALCGASDRAIGGSSIGMFDRCTAFHDYGSKGGFSDCDVA